MLCNGSTFERGAVSVRCQAVWYSTGTFVLHDLLHIGSFLHFDEMQSILQHTHPPVNVAADDTVPIIAEHAAKFGTTKGQNRPFGKPGELGDSGTLKVAIPITRFAVV